MKHSQFQEDSQSLEKNPQSLNARSRRSDLQQQDDFSPQRKQIGQMNFDSRANSLTNISNISNRQRMNNAPDQENGKTSEIVDGDTKISCIFNIKKAKFLEGKVANGSSLYVEVHDEKQKTMSQQVVDSKVRWGHTISFNNVQKRLQSGKKNSMVVLQVYSSHGIMQEKDKLFGKTDGIFFEDLVNQSHFEVEEQHKYSVYQNGSKIGVINFSTLLLAKNKLQMKDKKPQSSNEDIWRRINSIKVFPNVQPPFGSKKRLSIVIQKAIIMNLSQFYNLQTMVARVQVKYRQQIQMTPTCNDIENLSWQGQGQEISVWVDDIDDQSTIEIGVLVYERQTVRVEEKTAKVFGKGQVMLEDILINGLQEIQMIDESGSQIGTVFLKAFTKEVEVEQRHQSTATFDQKASNLQKRNLKNAIGVMLPYQVVEEEFKEEQGAQNFASVRTTNDFYQNPFKIRKSSQKQHGDQDKDINQTQIATQIDNTNDEMIPVEYLDEQIREKPQDLKLKNQPLNQKSTLGNDRTLDISMTNITNIEVDMYEDSKRTNSKISRTAKTSQRTENQLDQEQQRIRFLNHFQRQSIKKLEKDNLKTPDAYRSERSARQNTIEPDDENFIQIAKTLLTDDQGQQISQEQIQMLILMVQAGKIKLDELEDLEPPSYSKLIKFIDKFHPTDPQTKLKFGINERITVKDYYHKLMDVFFCYNMVQNIKLKCKNVLKSLRGTKNVKIFEKPDSLQNLPDSQSSSDSQDDDPLAKGLTTCAQKLGIGSTLYLQTMKTLMILFTILTVINLPVYYVYYFNTKDNMKLSLLEQFKFMTIGNLGMSQPFCGHTSIFFSNMFKTIDFEDNQQDLNYNKEALKLGCKDDFYISNIDYFGLLYYNDTITGSPSLGSRECHRINKPGEHFEEAQDLHSRNEGQRMLVGDGPNNQVLEQLGYSNQQYCHYCIDAGFRYCQPLDFVSQGVCKDVAAVDINSVYDYFSDDENEEGICSYPDTDEESKDLFKFICPQSARCESQKIFVPTEHEDPNELGFHLLAHDEFSNEDDQCSHWIIPNQNMSDLDILWLEFNFENIDVYAHILNGTEFNYTQDRSFKPYNGQKILIQKSNSIVITLKGISAEGTFDLNHMIQAVADHNFDMIYGDLHEQNRTESNIDSECKDEQIFASLEKYEEFNQRFIEQCMHKQNCEFQNTEIQEMVGDNLSESCKQRILFNEQKLTSNHLILVAGCKSDMVKLQPLLNGMVHKQDAGIFIIIFEILSILIILFFFKKLTQINNEYLGIIDDMQVEIKDFGIMFKNVKLDRYTQDKAVIKMKLWLHVQQVLKMKRSIENNMEIMDITVSMYSEPDVQTVFRMQEVQLEINEINEKIRQNEISEDKIDQNKQYVEQLKIKMTRLMHKYKQMTQIQVDETIETKSIKRKPKSQMKNSIEYIFVVFKNCQTKDTAHKIFDIEESWIQSVKKFFTKSNQRVKKYKSFLGKPLNCQKIISPDEIIWQNFAYNHNELTIRKIALYLFSIVFFAVMMVIMIYLGALDTFIKHFVPDKVCPMNQVLESEAYLDWLTDTAKRNGLLYCYCTQEGVTLWLPWSIFMINFKGISNGDNNIFACAEQSGLNFFRSLVTFSLSIASVLVNELIAKLFLRLGFLLKRHTTRFQQRISFIIIFVMEFCNMGLIVMINSFDFIGIQKALLGEIDIIQDRIYSNGFTVNWYEDWGQYICYQLFMSSIFVNAYDLILYIIATLRRFKDRSFKSSLKKDDEDENDDTPNTKKRSQKVLQELYLGKKFQGEKAYSRMMSTMFVILLYSSGMPILYFIGMIFFTVTYYINRLLIIKYYRFSTTMSQTIPLTMLQFIRYSLIFHVIIGLFMLTNKAPFMTREMSPMQGQGVYELKMDPSAYAQSLEDQTMGDFRPITGNKVSGGFLERFEMVHQQIYICFLAIFVFFLLIWKTLISILKTLFTIVFYTVKKLIQIVSVCLRRLAKRIKSKILCEEFVDSIESVKITDSDENLDSESDTEQQLNNSCFSNELESQDNLGSIGSIDRIDQPNEMNLQDEMNLESIQVQETVIRNDAMIQNEESKAQSKDLIQRTLESSDDLKHQIQINSELVTTFIDKTSSSILDRIEKDKEKLLKGGFENVNILSEVKSLKTLIKDSKASKKKKKEMQRARKEILLQAQFETEKLLVKKRMSYLDFSDNILMELNMMSLSNFYERSVRELSDLFHCFNLHDGLSKDVLDPDSTSFCRIHFLENIYMNHITQEQVIKYVNILQRRIKDIEKVINCHFKMIHQYIIKDVELVFEKQKNQRIKAGHQLDLNDELRLNENLKMALKNHPDVQFSNSHHYTYKRKLQKLINHQDDLVEADINQKDNRMATQTICRMSGSNSQSYYIFDSDNYKIARKIYFGIQPRQEHSHDDHNDIQDLGKNIKHLKEQQTANNSVSHSSNKPTSSKKNQKKRKYSNKVNIEQTNI